VPADWGAEADARLERHPLIAWKQSDQAVRAVDAAMPWLSKADKVTVLTVDRAGQPGDATKHLDGLPPEGVKAEWITAEPINGRTSARILATAEEIGASLIVMGAFRYGSLIEWALGATTQRAISQTKVPLLLAH
jgi:nucleotide-binding universal stress UspA family protein